LIYWNLSDSLVSLAAVHLSSATFQDEITRATVHSISFAKGATTICYSEFICKGSSISFKVDFMMTYR